MYQGIKDNRLTRKHHRDQISILQLASSYIRMHTFSIGCTRNLTIIICGVKVLITKLIIAVAIYIHVYIYIYISIYKILVGIKVILRYTYLKNRYIAQPYL